MKPAIKRIADLLLIDIRERGLQPGERYMTADEARQMFKVRKAVVNDAMRFLADQEILVRKRKAGTFVGPAFPADGVLPDIERKAGTISQQIPLYNRIHVLKTFDGGEGGSTLALDDYVPTLNDATGGSVVELHQASTKQFAGYVSQLIGEIKQRGASEGMVLVLSTREAQMLVQESGLPAVIFGSPHSGVHKIPSVDVDHFDIARRAADYSIAKGCKRFTLFMPSEWRRGDSLSFSGLTQALGGHGMSMDALDIRTVHSESHSIAIELKHELDQDHLPDMIFCRHAYIAKAVIREFEALPPDAPRPRVMSLYSMETRPQPFVCFAPKITSREWVQIIGRLLVHQTRGETIEPTQTLIESQLLEAAE